MISASQRAAKVFLLHTRHSKHAGDSWSKHFFTCAFLVHLPINPSCNNILDMVVHHAPTSKPPSTFPRHQHSLSTSSSLPVVPTRSPILPMCFFRHQILETQPWLFKLARSSGLCPRSVQSQLMWSYKTHKISNKLSLPVLDLAWY